MGVESYISDMSNLRLDLFLKSKKSRLTRSYIQKLISGGNVKVNGIVQSKPSFKLKKGSLLTVKALETRKLDIKPIDYDLEIIYEDKFIAVINKPAGIVVHPGKGNYDRTLVHILAGKVSNLSSIGGVERPGIVHRLDKDTSGIMIIAKNDFSHNFLTEAFKNREIKKTYLAVCYGIIPGEKGCIEGFISRDLKSRVRMKITKKAQSEKAKYCLTDFESVNYIKGAATAIKVMPLTGRTHQIRVSLLEAGYPIIGDKTYKRKDIIDKYKSLNFVKRQMLHAFSLEFFHPETGNKMFFKASIPPDMEWAFESGILNDL